MTDCPNGDVRDALPDYLNDRLGATRRREIESHLERCATCREELSLLRAMRVTMHRAPSVDVEAIVAAIPAYSAPIRRAWPRSWGIAAAIVAIAIGGTSITLLRGRSPAATERMRPRVAAAPATPSDTAPAAVARRAEVATTPTQPRVVRERASVVPTRELAMAGGAIGDLSDRELSALVEGIESLDGLPSTEVEGTEPVSSPTSEGQ